MPSNSNDPRRRPHDVLACRVCGLLQADPPWGASGARPTYNICACCGTEFGYDDATRSAVIRKRAAWQADGAVWFVPQEKPDNWSFAVQREQIPYDYVDDGA